MQRRIAKYELEKTRKEGIVRYATVLYQYLPIRC
jgi:hypothetical protein